MARLSQIPFDYPLRSYTMGLAYYFVRASSPSLPSEEMIAEFSADQEVELRRLVHQIQLSDGAPSASRAVIPALSSPDRFSMLTLCFPDEVDGYGVLFNPIDLIDGVVLLNEYHHEMLMMIWIIWLGAFCQSLPLRFSYLSFLRCLLFSKLRMLLLFSLQRFLLMSSLLRLCLMMMLLVLMW